MGNSEKQFTIENCEFSFKCPRHWEDLESTDKEDKRYCINCEREVFLVESKILFEAHARLGHCVAVHDPSRKKKSNFFLGGPRTTGYSTESALKWD